MRTIYVVLGLALLLALPAGAKAPASVSRAVVTAGPLGVVRAHGVPAAGLDLPYDDAWLSYHGGPVVHTNNTYAIYWEPKGHGVSSKYVSTINRYFADVAAASGKGSNVYSASTQYSDDTGAINYKSSFKGSWTDTSALPPSECIDAYTFDCVSDSQIRNEINKAITKQHWPRGIGNLYFVFTGRGLGSCSDSSNCAFSEYCGYHWSFGSGSSLTMYANMPYTMTEPDQCSTGRAPNDADADSTLSVVSHEHNEIITDPLGDGWWDDTNLYMENGDECAWTFGDTSGSYNQVINGHHYFLQREWSNTNDDCVLTYQPPTVTSFSPGSGTINATVTIKGAGFSQADEVDIAGSSMPFTIESDTVITADVPSGAVTGQISVTSALGTSTSKASFKVVPPPLKQSVLVFGNGGLDGDTTGIDFLEQLLDEAGYVVTTSTDLPDNLTGYGSIWYYDDVVPIADDDAARLTAFVKSGRGLYLTGERPCCEDINAADEGIVNSLVKNGGITVGGQGDPFDAWDYAPVNPKVVGNLAKKPFVVNWWLVNAPGGIAGVASADVLATSPDGEVPLAAAWDSAHLQGGKGRLALLMDVNWAEDDSRDDFYASELTQNLELFLSGLSAPPKKPVIWSPTHTVSPTPPAADAVDGGGRPAKPHDLVHATG